MQYNYYVYEKSEVSIRLNKVPIWFVEKAFTGNQVSGQISLHTQNIYDEIWGAMGRIDIEWEKKGRFEYLHAREVQKSIDMYNAIKVVVTDKEIDWVRSHEFSIWYGQRTKMVRKRVYPEQHIHAVFFCENTERQFDLHSTIIREHYEGFKPYVLDAMKSIICH